MARKSAAAQAIPSSGKQAVPYPTFRESALGLHKYGSESLCVELTGGGGIGASYVCPFEPAEVEIYVPATPLAQKSMPTSSGRAAVNLISGAAAAAIETITAVDANDPTKGFTVAIPTGILGNAAVGHVIFRGYGSNEGL